MPYTYRVMSYPEAYEDVRAIFGVDNLVLSDEVINALPNMPAAEVYVIGLLPNFISFDASEVLKLRLAILYHTAANCYQTVKINVLRIETDNKTMGTRFNDTFSMTEDDLRKRASGYISELQPAAAGTAELFTVSKPAIDVITGN